MTRLPWGNPPTAPSEAAAIPIADSIFVLDETDRVPCAFALGDPRRLLARDHLQAGRASRRFAGNEALPAWLIYGGSDSFELNGARVMARRYLASQHFAPARSWP